MSRPIWRSALLALAIFLSVLGCDSGTSDRGCESGRPIPGQYLVTLKDTVRDIPSAARRLADDVDGELISVWTTALKGFAIEGITDRDAQTLRRAPSVKRVSQDECFEAFTADGARSMGGPKSE